MENCVITVSPDGKKATIEIDLSYRGNLTGSGRNVTVASTRGAVPLGNTGIKASLNAYTSSDNKPAPSTNGRRPAAARK